MDNKLLKEEYELQFFGVTPDTIIEGVKAEMLNSLDEMFGKIKDKLVDRKEIAKTEEIHHKYTESIVEKLQEVAPEIQEIMEIPENVSLPGDEIYHKQDMQCIEDLEKEVEQAEKDYQQLKIYEQCLNHELNELSTMLPLGEALEGVIESNCECKRLQEDIKTIINDFMQLRKREEELNK